jgi:hypothetical protein
MAILLLSGSASARPAKPRPARPMTAEEVAQVSALVAPATVVATQAFVVDVRGSARSFAPGLLDGHYVHHEGIAGSSALERFVDPSWPAAAIEAVAFDDVSGDRLPDAVVLIRFAVPGAQPFTAARVFRRERSGRLTLDWYLSDAANLPAAPTTMKEVRQRLAQKKDILGLPTPRLVNEPGAAMRFAMTGNVDDAHLRCVGRAWMARRQVKGRDCLEWALLEDHCAGSYVAEFVQGDSGDGQPRWRSRDEGAGVVLCREASGWIIDTAPLPGLTSCQAKVSGGSGLPARVQLACDMKCRSPSTCAGSSEHLLTVEPQVPAALVTAPAARAITLPAPAKALGDGEAPLVTGARLDQWPVAVAAGAGPQPEWRELARHALTLGSQRLTLVTFNDGADSTSLAVVGGDQKSPRVLGTFTHNPGGNGGEVDIDQTWVSPDQKAALVLLRLISRFRPYNAESGQIEASEDSSWVVLGVAGDRIWAASDELNQIGDIHWDAAEGFPRLVGCLPRRKTVLAFDPGTARFKPSRATDARCP